MIIQTIQGRDIRIDASERVVLRVQGRQWRYPATSGSVTIPGSVTRDLRYYGGKRITGDVWVGKAWHAIHINPRG